MPLIEYKKIAPSGELGIWQISENKDFFTSSIDLSEEEVIYMESIKGNLQIEWLASRCLLHKMSGRTVRGKLLKDAYGKPFLEGSEYHISLSHSKDLAAVIASPISCGIDIQLIVPKIQRIAPKYMNAAELESLDKEQIFHMHLYWGAKECLYKSYGRRLLDFKKHILIEPFQLSNDKGTFYGRVEKEDFLAQYEIKFERLNNYVLVYSLEINDEI